jgi:predicted ArsR family transcriptional regulator
MSTTKLDKRFFESTRGRIVLLLRKGGLTVNDLAKELGLTDNAVRAHLLALERDGLVQQQGTVKGFRKPHYVYGLSESARDLFPRPYGVLFNRLLSSLKEALSRAAFLGRLKEVGSSIGAETSPNGNSTQEDRIQTALAAIESMGGSAQVVKENGHTVIRSSGCPFSEAVEEHPEVCKVTESMLSEILHADVEEICDRTGSPKCKFVVKPS